MNIPAFLCLVFSVVLFDGEMHIKLVAEDGADRGQEEVYLSVFTLPVSALIRHRHAETSTESVFIWSCTCHLKQRERSF